MGTQQFRIFGKEGKDSDKYLWRKPRYWKEIIRGSPVYDSGTRFPNFVLVEIKTLSRLMSRDVLKAFDTFDGEHLFDGN